MEGAGAAGGRLRVRRRSRQKGDRGATGGLRGRAAGRRLRRLRLAGGRCEDVRQDPAGVLPRPRAPQLCESAQGDEFALRQGGHRAHCSRLRDRGEDPRPRRRGTPGGAPGRDEAADGGVEGPSGSGEGRDLSAVDADQGDRLHARTLGGSDGFPGRRAARAGHQHGRAIDPADCNREEKFLVQRRRRRGRDLGDPLFASQHGPTEWRRSRGLSRRRSRAHGERRHEDQPASRPSGLELEGRARCRKTRRGMTPPKQRWGTRGARKPAKTTMADYAMSFERLGQWMSERARSPRLRHPQATSRSMLDGAVTAVVVGPVSMAPEEWVCPLLGVDPDAFNHDTEEFSAIAATLSRHNAISEALSTRPESFEPLFARSWDGEVDAQPWCMGFYAVMKLRLLAWSRLISPDRIEHYLLLPIL